MMLVLILKSLTETDLSDWDRVTLKKLASVVDFHSIHRTSLFVFLCSSLYP